MIYYIIAISGVLACSASQLLLKKSADRKYKTKISNLLNWRVLISYSIFFMSLLINIYAMKNGVGLKDLPILESVGYIAVPCLSYLVLKERIDNNTLIAIFFILSGIIIFYM